MPIDMKQFSQPYVGTEAEMLQFINDLVDAQNAATAVVLIATAVQLGDAAADINTINKEQGRVVYEVTNGLLYAGDGPDPTDTWTLVDGVGSTQVTPS